MHPPSPSPAVGPAAHDPKTCRVTRPPTPPDSCTGAGPPPSDTALHVAGAHDERPDPPHPRSQSWPLSCTRIAGALFERDLHPTASEKCFYNNQGLKTRGRTHPAIKPGCSTAQAGIKTRLTSAADLVPRLETTRRQGRLEEVLDRRVPLHRLPAVDGSGHLPLTRNQANPLFQVVSRRCERGSVVLTGNPTFGARDQALAGDAVLAAAKLNRLMHHAPVVQITGEGHRLKGKRKEAPCPGRRRPRSERRRVAQISTGVDGPEPPHAGRTDGRTRAHHQERWPRRPTTPRPHPRPPESRPPRPTPKPHQLDGRHRLHSRRRSLETSSRMARGSLGAKGSASTRQPRPPRSAAAAGSPATTGASTPNRSASRGTCSPAPPGSRRSSTRPSRPPTSSEAYARSPA